VEYLVKLEEYKYRFDLKAVFDRLSIPYPYQTKPILQQELFPPEEREEIMVSAQTIRRLAAEAGFVIDENDAQRLLGCTEPEWFRGKHAFIFFVANKIREHEKYSKKSKEDQRRIFRKVLFDAENYRQEYPGWRDEQERHDRKCAAIAEHKIENEKIKNNPPVVCQCGEKFDKNQCCPACGGSYCFDDLGLNWTYYKKTPAHIACIMGKLKASERKEEEA
jgi:hypothetical protein